MNILVSHSGTPAENAVASSILKGMTKVVSGDTQVTWVVSDRNCLSLFRYNTRCVPVFYQDLMPINHHYDVLINLHPICVVPEMTGISFDEAIGFGYDKTLDIFLDVLYGQTPSKLSLFQIYFKASGMTWRGEGCDIGYYPKSRTNRKKVGLAIANANLRNYVSDRLNLDKISNFKGMTLWHVPYKKNILKRMNEINKCKEIITDDFLTLNLALYLRKHVYFLETISLNTRIEFFGFGRVFQVPTAVLI